ncbi:MAG TPA: type II toxin-antitoxin system VapC family toxin [Stellaceae bacterium]|nr:type II toxin-antitoxin system VapC family toxin [Stellaceae bacterium]
MVVKVVDTSALAAILFDEPGADVVASQLVEATLVAPSLLAYELANVCLIKLRRHPEQRDVLLATYALRDRFPLEMVEVDHTAVLEAAIRTGLTVYDASYYWLARKLGAELVTLDRQLAAAAK